MSKSNNGPDIAPELFERAKAGDKRAMDVVLAALRPTLHTLATRSLRGRTEAAEDVTQDALLALWQDFKKIESVEKLLPYAANILRNRALRAKTAAARESDFIVYDSELADAALDGHYVSEFGRPLGDGNYLTTAAVSSDDVYE